MAGFTFSGGGGGGGGGAVSSVFGRSGAVLAVAGDYTATKITNTPAGTISSTNVQAAINELDGDVTTLASTVGALVTGVSSVFGRSGAVVALAGDYTGAKVTNTPAGNIAATDVQAAINELDSEKAGLALANTFLTDQTVTGFLSATSLRIGASPVVDANRIILPRSYTIGTLPAVTATGIIFCSDLGGGPGLLQSDGTGWERVKDEGTATITTDAGHTATWARLTDAPVIRGNATLTAARTLTLSTTGCRNGDRVQVVRLGGGAFDWSIVGGTTFALTAANQWCVFEFDGTAWNVIAAGIIQIGIGVQDEGVALNNSRTLNFVGAGVTATNAAGGVTTITIPGSAGGSGISIGLRTALMQGTNF